MGHGPPIRQAGTDTKRVKRRKERARGLRDRDNVLLGSWAGVTVVHVAGLIPTPAQCETTCAPQKGHQYSVGKE